MKREPFDDIMTRTLEEEGKKVSLSSRKQEEILGEIRRIKENEERGAMVKMRSVKKTVLAAAVMCIFAAFGVMAAGKVTGLRSSINPDEVTYTAFSQVREDGERIGFEPYGKESYDNGLTFAKGYLTDVEGFDEGGNAVEVRPELMLYYQEGDREVLLTANQPFNTDKIDGNVVRKEEYKGLELKYEENKYLFVPADYQLDEAMKEEEAEGKVTISYGLPPQDDGTPAEPEEEMMYSVSWEDNGIDYLLLSTGDEPVMGDSLVAMAKETIDAKDSE